MDKHLPLYIQLYSSLKDEIIEQKWKIDQKIPTEKELSEQYDVSLVTVRKAIEMLTDDGYLSKKSGIGTWVVNNKAIIKTSKSSMLSDLLEKNGKKLTKKLITAEVIDNDISDEFETKKLLLIERIYFIDNVEYIYMRHYIDCNISPKKVSDEFSLYNELYKQGHKIGKFNDSFATVKLDPVIAKALKTENYVLQRTRKSYTETNKLVEISYNYYNTEVQQYEIELQV